MTQINRKIAHAEDLEEYCQKFHNTQSDLQINIISLKGPMIFFIVIEKVILKFYEATKDPRQQRKKKKKS